MAKTDQEIQTEMHLVREAILTVKDLQEMFPFADGTLPTRNAVQRWLMQEDKLGKRCFYIDEKPVILRIHLGDWQPPKRGKART